MNNFDGTSYYTWNTTAIYWFNYIKFHARISYAFHNRFINKMIFIMCHLRFWRTICFFSFSLISFAEKANSMPNQRFIGLVLRGISYIYNIFLANCLSHSNAIFILAIVVEAAINHTLLRILIYCSCSCCISFQLHSILFYIIWAAFIIICRENFDSKLTFTLQQ